MADHDTHSVPVAPGPPVAVSAGELAGIYDAMATVVGNDEATTFTDDRLFDAACRLADALTQKIVAARHIRGDRPVE